MNKPMDRRTELLDQIVGIFLERGVASLSLRPLADQVGTSARLLIYHFESKENLVACALGEIRERVSRALRARATDAEAKTLRDLLRLFWEWATHEPNQSYFRVLFEVDGLCMFGDLRPSQRSRRAGGEVWITMIEAALRRLPAGQVPAPERATLIMGALNGLLQDFLTTGDRERTESALEEFTRLAEYYPNLTAEIERSGL